MFKKLQRNIVFLFMLFIIPLTIGNVNCSWTYYEGKIDDLSITLDSNNIILGEFNFDLKPGFPNTEDGKANNDAQDQIFTPSDPNNQNHGLDFAFSNLNYALTGDNPTNSDFISSVDKERYGLLDREYSGQKYKDDLGLPANVNFIIERLPNEDTVENGKRVQYYYIYTTTFDINKIIVKKGKITPNSPKYVYDIYRTKYKWTANNTGNFGMSGKYTRVSDAQVGYARTAINKENNDQVGFFKPSGFVPEKFIK